MSDSRVTVVVPAKDEEGLIGEIVDAVKPFADEVLVVDGHSRDRTPAIAAEHGARVITDHGHGKGEALRIAIDQDFSAISTLVDVGGGHGTLEQFIRYVGSQLIMLAINYRWNVRLTDSQNGFRAIRRDVGARLGLTSNLTTIEQEMLMKALKQGFRVSEVASHEYERRWGTSKVVVWKLWFPYVWSFLRNLI